jgi:hypothetical protein
MPYSHRRVGEVFREYRFRLSRALHDPRAAATRGRVDFERLISPSTLFWDSGHQLSDSVFLASSGRSGSTWLSDILASNGRIRVINEPLKPDRVKLARDFEPMGTYLRTDDSAPKYREAIDKILTGRIRGRFVDVWNQSRRSHGRLIKETRGTNLLPWLAVNYPSLPIIYLIRHPIAVASSGIQVGWGNELEYFLNQPDLVADHLAPFLSLVPEPTPLLARVLQWCFENYVPTRQLSPDSALVVFYEDLVLYPERELKRLGVYLRSHGDGSWRTWAPDMSSIRRPSRMSFRQALPSEPLEWVDAWKREVPKELQHTAMEIVQSFALDDMYGDSVLPAIKSDDLLRLNRVKDAN